MSEHVASSKPFDGARDDASKAALRYLAPTVSWTSSESVDGLVTSVFTAASGNSSSNIAATREASTLNEATATIGLEGGHQVPKDWLGIAMSSRDKQMRKH